MNKRLYIIYILIFLNVGMIYTNQSWFSSFIQPFTEVYRWCFGIKIKKEKKHKNKYINGPIFTKEDRAAMQKFADKMQEEGLRIKREISWDKEVADNNGKKNYPTKPVGREKYDPDLALYRAMYPWEFVREIQKQNAYGYRVQTLEKYKDYWKVI